MFAIIEDSGTQIKVNEGDVIKVALRDLPQDVATITFDRVLFVGEGATAKIGTPVVEGATVTADILGEERGPKIEIAKYRRRKNYRRRKGHRQDYLKVKITAIKA